MPAKDAFDIYETEAGYVAVTNSVRRKILTALAKGDLELSDLVKATGRAKPTLSNLHVKDLLSKGLVEELPHPTDARRKLYRLRGSRIGTSDVPIERLRGAVKQYVTRSPLAFTLPFPAALEVILAGAGSTSHAALRAQGRALGARSAPIFQATTARDLVQALCTLLEREGIARVGKMDFDVNAFEVEPLGPFAHGSVDALAAALGGFAEGVAVACLGGAWTGVGRPAPGDRAVIMLSG